MLRVKEYLCTSCGLCARVCPSGAISLRFGKAQIDPKKCIGCHACSSVCPSHAIQSIYVSDLGELMRRLNSVNQRIGWVSRRLDRLTVKHPGRQ